MKKMALRVAVVAVVAAFLAVAAGVAFALFSDQQATSGAVGMATADDVDLYICEPGGTPGPDCGSDDSGADEAVWETTEELLPGHDATWDIRLKNVGTYAWDTGAPTVTIMETADPGGDCDAVPGVVAKILGKAGDAVNDNHAVSYWDMCGSYSLLDLEAASYTCYTVHVEPGDYEDIRLHAPASSDWGNECSENAWSIVVDWTVTNH
jgi:hypothetical protein